MEVDHVPIDAIDAKRYASGGGQGGYNEFGGMTTEDVHMYSQYQKVHGHGDYLSGGMGTGQTKHYSQRQFGAFDGMALSQDFLWDYYSRVSVHFINASIKSTTKSYIIITSSFYRLYSLFHYTRRQMFDSVLTLLLTEIQPCSTAGPNQGLNAGL